MLDGKEVSEATRLFLQSWQANKEMKRAMQKQRQDMNDYEDDERNKNNRLPDLGLHHHSLEAVNLAKEASFILPQPESFTRQSKQLTNKLNKEAEQKDPVGNILKAI